jgi:gamma-glutamylcyclotransferase (GGCT)/AIG2-like uncharacterized protein YtfP
MGEPSRYLFVYGTLRRDSAHPMARFLEQHGRFVALAKTPGRLYDLGAYPGMLRAGAETDWVHGDLYELTNPEWALAELDKYEGCVPEHPQPYVFERAQGEVISATGASHQAWLYFYSSSIDEARRILSGNYLPRPQAR